MNLHATRFIRGFPMRIVPFAALMLCGCYVNVPLSTLSPDPGTRVHVELTDQGSIDLAKYLGPNVAAVDGRLVQGTDSALSVSVSDVSMRSGDEQYWKGESVTLPRYTVATVRQKKLSVWRSGLIGGLFLAGVVAIGAVSGGSGPASGNSGTPQQPK
jgi:hypothetical protein